MLFRFIKRCVPATLTRDVKSMNYKIDKVSADATALTCHEETEWCLGCLPHCFAIAYVVQSDPYLSLCIWWHMGDWGCSFTHFSP